MTDGTLPDADPIRVRLKRRKAQPFYFRHPWVFDGAIDSVDADVTPIPLGREAILETDRGEPLARGLFNPGSSLKLRLYSWDPEERLDAPFWGRRLDEAIRLRRRLFSDWGSESAFRLVFSEADGLSGLIVDRYGDYLLVQLTAGVLLPRLDMLLEELRQRLNPKGIWLRTEKGVTDTEGIDLSDRKLWGDAPPRPLFIKENGVTYGVDTEEGQKTGFFLDQRENRAAAAGYFRGGHLLDVCSYAGGFSLTALQKGSVDQATVVDVSKSALALCRANAELNGFADRIDEKQLDAWKALEEFQAAGTSFDAVVLDPPKMTRHRRGIDRALKGYFALNQLAVEVLKPGGILVTCSCSGLITGDDFLQMLATVAMRTGRRMRVLESRGASPDHPVAPNIPETEYLKCVICEVA
ncbi:class I SAM-dependent rRNA methyltransferase [Stratiformator vulcanicus]|uniref:Ribosomal RNA large subunit methyltransferase I n=1 Tax=Stratiformator vulcanicus TaxID=2527980 RepID=A0A517R623_9PLAN|nr:class I SAM-dependent rRNA methyltransferase [Stratiformator vulcanicus]QDT39312.1 Ribosomal RNA large subunit methyltransferase I [Stratiformator vulcanicus]